MQIFNMKKALDLVDGDKSLLGILIESFLTESRFDRRELLNLVSEKKFEDAAGYVHAVKGAARQLCLEKLQKSGQNLEDVLRGKSKGDISSLEEEMAKDYKEAAEFLKSNRLS